MLETQIQVGVGWLVVWLVGFGFSLVFLKRGLHVVLGCPRSHYVDLAWNSREVLLLAGIKNVHHHNCPPNSGLYACVARNLPSEPFPYLWS